MGGIVTHEHPVWRSKANFLIGARFRLCPDDVEWWREQLWARQLGKRRFMICCIPFFLYDLALGDIVTTCRDTKYMLSAVERPSGHSTFRAWFHDEQARFDVHDWVIDGGYLFEWRHSTGSLLAIDAACDESAQALADMLWAKEQQGLLKYETGQTR